MGIRAIVSMTLLACLLGAGSASANVDGGTFRLPEWCGEWTSDTGAMHRLCVSTYTSVYGWGPWRYHASVAHRPFTVWHEVVEADGTRRLRYENDPVTEVFVEIPDRMLSFRGEIRGCAVELALVAEADAPSVSPSAQVDPAGSGSRVAVAGGASGPAHGAASACDDGGLTPTTRAWTFSSAVVGVSVR